MMKTLLLTPGLYTGEGGIPRVAQLYARSLARLKGQVAIVARHDPEPLAHPHHGFVVHGCGGRRRDLLRTVWKMAPGLDDMVCLHTHLLPAAWLARRANPALRVFLVAHGIEAWERLRWRERMALPGLAGLWSVSRYTQERFIESNGRPACRCEVLNNPLDPAWQERALERAGRPVVPGRILVVTRLSADEDYKGVDTLIKALPVARRSEPAAHLEVVGRGDDLPRLRELAESCGVADLVRFHGFVPDEDLADLFAESAIFALPSGGEGFGLVYLEAMAFGRPCLAGDAGGAPEVVTPDVGAVIPCREPVATAEAIVRLMRNPPDPAAVRAHADRFSLDAFTRRLEELMRP